MVYLVETKTQGQLTRPNVLRKRKDAVAWCDCVNRLDPELSSGAHWHYVLLGEDIFYNWRDKGASTAEMVAFARFLPVDDRKQGHFVS